jgi:hypothetical protein
LHVMHQGCFASRGFDPGSPRSASLVYCSAMIAPIKWQARRRAARLEKIGVNSSVFMSDFQHRSRPLVLFGNASHHRIHVSKA